jgi:hypothetical protein
MTPQMGANTRQNPARLKNLLRTAEEKLVAQGMPAREAEQLLAGAFEPLEPTYDWGQLGRGMAMFAGERGSHFWRLPTACTERCEVGRSFYILPLVQSLADDATYYVLAVSQNEVRLLSGSQHELEQVEVPGLPANRAAEALLEDREKTLQAHLGRPQVPGKGDLMYHGHGGAPDASKDEIEGYFRSIDRAIAKFMRDKTEPLVFAGVEYLFPIYQQVNGYRRLLPTPVTGNPEVWSQEEIRDRAWPVVAELVESRRDAERARYGDRISAGQTSDELEKILVAAHAGAVETLFIDPRGECLGVFLSETSTVRIDDSPQPDSEDLINLAAVLVLRASGVVEPLESNEIPGDGAMAAILRYPLAVESGRER